MINSRRYPKKVNRKNRSKKMKRKITKGGEANDYALSNFPENFDILNNNNNQYFVTKNGINLYSINYVKPNEDYLSKINRINNRFKDENKQENEENKKKPIPMPIELKIKYFNDHDLLPGPMFILTPQIVPPPPTKKPMFSISKLINSNPVRENFINVISNIYLTKEDITPEKDDFEYKKHITITNTNSSGNIIGIMEEGDYIKYTGIQYHTMLTPTSIVTLTPTYFIIKNENNEYYFCRKTQFWYKGFSERGGGVSKGYKIVKDGISRLTDDEFFKRVNDYYTYIKTTRKLPTYNTTNWIK